MATRANILFVKDVVIETRRIRDIEKHSFLNIYSHYDGYPEYLGNDLIEAVEIIKKGGRIEDIDYATMCIVNYIVDKNKEDIKNQKLTGFGISTEVGDDIEYLYIVNMNMRYIFGYEINFEENGKRGDVVLEHFF